MAGGTVQALIGEPVAPTSALADRFEVHLSNFEGPFDLLLSLIAKHKLDVTEVALSQVTCPTTTTGSGSTAPTTRAAAS